MMKFKIALMNFLLPTTTLAAYPALSQEMSPSTDPVV